jgi:hypothetical protein
MLCPAHLRLLGVLLLLTAGAAAQKPSRPAGPTKIKVAEGKYVLTNTAGKVERTFEEPWALYKTNLGYALESQWHVGGAEGEAGNVIDVRVNFAGGLHPTDVTIGGDPDRALHCRLALSEFSCRSMGLEGRQPMAGTYDFYSPSPWMLGSIVRRSKKLPGQTTRVQLVRMRGMQPGAGPVLDAFAAEVDYVGDDQIEIGERKYDSSIFELKAQDAIPGMLVWVSAEGIVLALQDSSKTEQRMELVEYRKLGKL